MSNEIFTPKSGHAFYIDLHHNFTFSGGTDEVAFLKAREQELFKAIVQHKLNNLPVPAEWVTEYNFISQDSFNYIQVDASLFAKTFYKNKFGNTPN